MNQPSFLQHSLRFFQSVLETTLDPAWPYLAGEPHPATFFVIINFGIIRFTHDAANHLPETPFVTVVKLPNHIIYTCMKGFRNFIENFQIIPFVYNGSSWDKEILPKIRTENSTEIKKPYHIFRYLDPDDYYGDIVSGGLFTFTYSDRKIQTPDGQTKKEGLVIAPPWKNHRYVMSINKAVKDDYDYEMLTGRYGITEHTPILAVWEHENSLLNECISVMLENNIIHPDYFLYIDGLYANNKKEDDDEVVDVNGRQYKLRSIPGLLHSLPSMSPEHESIRQFVCANHDKYPFLKNVLGKAKCVNYYKPRTPEWDRRQQYWPTSETHTNS